MAWYENRRGELLWYEDAGIGHPIVLVHGWCMSSVVWMYQFDRLADSLRLVAPDLRGHGRSRDVSGYCDFQRFADDLVDLLVALDLTHVILVGWSMGAQIVMQSYFEHANRIAGMVLVSATPCFTASHDFSYGLAESEVNGMRIKLRRNTQRALTDFYTRMFADGELGCHLSASEIMQLLSTVISPDTSALFEALDALDRMDMRDRLTTIRIPTLIINGALDQICLPQASRYLYEHIQGAEHVVFPDCGHAPFMTRRDEFNVEITEFARRVREQNV